MKIDIAIQSYKKPELLLYTLLHLKKYSQQYIDQIWIQDDSSDHTVIDFYQSEQFKSALYPWKVNVKANTQRGGWWFTPVKGLYPNYLSIFKRTIFSLRAKYKGTGFSLERTNSRYQWGIDSTDKKFLLIIHDDIIFYKDVVSMMLSEFGKDNNLAIMGDLGQCWRCEYHISGCNSDKVDGGYRPSEQWPDINSKTKENRWPCRVNEWCCMIDIEKTNSVEKKYHVLFGGYDNHGDIAAYWFSLINKLGYNFKDITYKKNKKNLFLHADGGSGHSVWVDQGDGKKIYDASHIKQKITNEFGIFF